jgi:hypothetical protein
MRRNRTIIQALIGATVVTGGAIALAPSASAITTPIETIGPATITRSTFLGLASYRIAEVSPTGSLTLTTGVNFTNGKALGDGGAIPNFGAVTLTKSSLSGNYASRDGGGLANADTASGTAPAATFTRSPVSNNTAGRNGGGIYNGLRGTLTTSGVSEATTLTQTVVTTNTAVRDSGGVYREGGTMTTTNSPISANTTNNCVGSAPGVPDCTH